MDNFLLIVRKENLSGYIFLFSCGIKTNTELTNKAKNRKTNQMKLNSNTDPEQIQLILERMNLYNESFV